MTETRDKLWTIDELAGYAQVSRDTIERAIKKQGVQVLRIGRSVHITNDEAMRLLRRDGDV